MENKNLFLIHGAWASRQAFNYLVKKTLDDVQVGRIHCFEYDCQSENLNDTVLRAKQHLRQIQENGLETVVVGHSLGGLIGLSMSHKKGISTIITAASPLAGIRLPKPFQYFVSFHTPVLTHLSPKSTFIRKIQGKDYSNNSIDVLVTTTGFLPMLYEKNDGVITIDSQTTWTPKGAKVIYSNTNHHEILQSAELIRSVEKALTS